MNGDLARWADAADAYGAFVEGDLLRREILLPALDSLLGDVAGKRIADLGCGTGSYAAALVARGAQVSACDGVPAFVATARTRIAPHPVLLHDLTQPLPASAVFPSGGFDIVLAHMVLHSLEDPAPLIDAAFRLLAPGGRLVLTTLHPAFTPPAAKVHAGILGRLLPSKRRLVVVNYFAEKRVLKKIQASAVPALPYHHRTLDTLSRILGRAGFALTAIHEPRPSGTSPVAADPATAHALRAPLFLLLEAKPHPQR